MFKIRSVGLSDLESIDERIMVKREKSINAYLFKTHLKL